MCKQILMIIGLVLSLLGAYKLYKSIIPMGPLYAKDGSNRALPNATLDINVAKKGLIYISIGIIFQIISVAMSVYYDIINLNFKFLCL